MTDEEAKVKKFIARLFYQFDGRRRGMTNNPCTEEESFAIAVREAIRYERWRIQQLID